MVQVTRRIDWSDWLCILLIVLGMGAAGGAIVGFVAAVVLRLIVGAI